MAPFWATLEQFWANLCPKRLVTLQFFFFSSMVSFCLPSVYVCTCQGDQIGRFFALWAIVYFEAKFFLNCKRSPKFLPTFYFRFDKIWFGATYIMSDFFHKPIRSPALQRHPFYFFLLVFIKSGRSLHFKPQHRTYVVS
jgi:hypothetical protein